MTAAKVQQSAQAPPARLAGVERLTRLIHRASHAGRRLRRLLSDHVDRWNLADSEFLVLWLCDGQPEHGLGQGELASAVGVSPAQMSTLVERLRKRELIAVERLGGDRRRQVWQIAPAGRKLLAEIRSGLAALANRLEERVAAGERLTAEELFERLAAVAADEAGLRLFDPEVESPAACVASRTLLGGPTRE